jgi:hypothetical protein
VAHRSSGEGVLACWKGGRAGDRDVRLRRDNGSNETVSSAARAAAINSGESSCQITDQFIALRMVLDKPNMHAWLAVLTKQGQY